jgi:hypothetical protein
MPIPFTILALFLPALAAAADPPGVVELFEDDTAGLIPKLTMGGIGGGENTKIEAETADVFAGKAALRVAASQRFNPDVKGWDFPIAEKPKAGEYRYLRFAWKKLGEGPLMVQFHTRGPKPDWYIRYHAGAESPPWEAKVVSTAAPREWAVVTRDLFTDFGAVTLGGVAFTPYVGADGLFDHILLGRTVEDLDRATAAVMLKTPSKEPLTSSQLQELWDRLGQADGQSADAAGWQLVRGHKEAVPFLRKTIAVPEGKAPLPVDADKVKPLIAGLTHYRYLTRAAAEDELRKLGPGALPHVRKAMDEVADGDAKARLQAILDGWDARAGLDVQRLKRCATVLRAVGTPEAKELLAKIEAAVP